MKKRIYLYSLFYFSDTYCILQLLYSQQDKNKNIHLKPYLQYKKNVKIIFIHLSK